MKNFALLLMPLFLLACGKGESEVPEASVQVGIDRSVADVRAAETAASGPVTFAPSAGELSARNKPTEAVPAGE